MNQPLERPLETTGFVPYTAFPAAELALEQHLGPNSKLLLPEAQRSGFVRFLPWIALLFLPLHFAGITFLLGMSAFGTMFGGGSLLRALLSTAIFALDVIALPGLFQHTRRGWAFFTYALLAGALSNLLSFSIFGLAISVGLIWLAFQVKYRYV